MRVKLIKQHDEKDCGAACLRMIMQSHGYHAPLMTFIEMTNTDSSGTSVHRIIRAAENLGMEAEGLSGSMKELSEALASKEVTVPFIAHTYQDTGMLHFIVIEKIGKNNIYAADPGKGKVSYTIEEFEKIWTGYLITFQETPHFKPQKSKNVVLQMCFGLALESKWQLGILLFLSLIIVLIGIVGAFVFQFLLAYIDAYTLSLNNENLVKISSVCIGILFLYLVNGVIEVLRGKLLSGFVRRLDTKIMTIFYEHTLDMPVSFWGTRKTGEIMSRYGDIAKIRDAISNMVISLILDTLMVIVGIVFLYRISPKLLMITGVTVFLYCLIVFAFQSSIKKVNSGIMENNAKMTAYIKEAFDGILTVKNLQAEPGVKSRIGNLLKKTVNSMYQGTMINVYRSMLIGVVSSAGTLIVLWCGALEVVNGSLSFGELITFYSLIGYFMMPVLNLMNLQPNLQAADVAAERLGDILLLKTEDRTAGADTPCLSGDIRFEQVSFKYGNDEWTLKNINLKIKEGCKTAIIGKSGSGKTTLVKLIMRYYQPEEGNISIGELPLSNIKISCVRDKISYISQETFIFADTVRNNILLGCEHISEEELSKVCAICEMDQFVSNMPMGYHTYIEENGANLSGGQRQRISIARALLRKPSILIMDEATSNLDAETERNILSNLKLKYSQMTLIIVTHREDVIKSCDEVIVMEQCKGMMK